MENPYCIDAFSPTSSSEIKAYFIEKLKPIIDDDRDIIFLCIGTDRSTGDSLGPLIGYKLKSIISKNLYIYGSLESPIHATNILNILDKIKINFNNPYIVAIDAALGSAQNIGKIIIDNKPLSPGAAFNKSIPLIGNMSIKGIVNISSGMDFTLLQNTRLYTVMTLADCISNGITLFSKSI
ncbi:MAG: spore protease YyaC [Clostridium sp.]|nr:spore protease YyaC [Clostridium sp.]